MTKSIRVQSNVALPEGIKLAKVPAKNNYVSETEYFPVSQLGVGDSFYVPGYTARQLRGTIHKKTNRTFNKKFVSRTIETKNGVAARVWRIR